MYCSNASAYNWYKSQEVAEGRTAHNNGMNGANGMASNTWKPMCRMHLISFHLFSSSHYYEPVLPNEGATNLL